jgi:hypothetical protein
MRIKRIGITVLALLALSGLTAGTASAAQCGYDGTTASPSHGAQARFYNLRTSGNMNCASARYVMGKLRAQYRVNGRIRTSFFDGYVTWHGYKTGRYGWQFYENTSNTSFSFSAVQSYWDW